ncbi:ArdC-like ssDNA-binding domain-containing protein [Natronoglomus mannanivorans]|uniref:ArdC-like ssDNA-binding domain-containing protein n=1 Tax=Natronoglomus mannanivorans TaxID=2979990 RepID=A0AAP2Z442_9EURY|nr:ArdC-like ssDNA-binding domain-containing protein [Halobacteria archaeon AArc-xg1-1]
MTPSSCSRESFDDSDTRHDEMHSTIETWAEDLVDEVYDAVSSEQFQEWLDVQSNFHDYSHRNTLLITRQCPHATRVAGYRTWQKEFDRHVKEGETAIWIWAPIIAKQCPECGNSPSYHDRSDCEYDDTPADEWEKGLVGFRPAPVFDISQTDGEPLPDLETEATGEADELVPALLEAASSLEVGSYSIDEPRTRRALTENMDVHFTRPGPIYEVVSESENTYKVDVEAETCTCSDFEQRQPDGGCKHLRRVDLEIRTGLVPAPDGIFVR